MKNMDPLNDNIISLLQNSSDNFVSLLWKDSGMVTLSLNGSENHSPTGFIRAPRDRGAVEFSKGAGREPLTSISLAFGAYRVVLPKLIISFFNKSWEGWGVHLHSSRLHLL